MYTKEIGKWKECNLLWVIVVSVGKSNVSGVWSALPICDKSKAYFFLAFIMTTHEPIAPVYGGFEIFCVLHGFGYI
jgi:hypothetical protein